MSASCINFSMLEMARFRSTCIAGGTFFWKLPKVGRASPAITIVGGVPALIDIFATFASIISFVYSYLSAFPQRQWKYCPDYGRELPWPKRPGRSPDRPWEPGSLPGKRDGCSHSDRDVNAYSPRSRYPPATIAARPAPFLSASPRLPGPCPL